MSVSEKFQIFCSNIKISQPNLDTIADRYHEITKRINKDFWGAESEDAHSLYVGSFGRDTEIFCSDVDMLVALPYETYQKYNSYADNGQSALLQEVKRSISNRYPNTDLKGDGQIVSVTFGDGINFEVLPAFLNKDKSSYTFPNSNDGGSWRITDPRSEIQAIAKVDKDCNHNLKRLCKMVRSWKDANNVSMSGILIDILAYRFIQEWDNRDKSFLYYDWMTRDFFKYLTNVPKTQSSWKAMGSDRRITDYGCFQAKANKAYEAAVTAIEYEDNGKIWSANQKWREVYGTKFPE